MTEIVAAHLERVAREWLTASNGERFYVSPDGNWLIWETRSPTAADEAHRGLAAALAACARESEIRGLRVAAGICDAFKMSEYGPHGTEWLASPHVETVADEIREVIGNLEDALERAAGESSLAPQGGQHES